MFLKKLIHRLIENDDVINIVFFCAFTLIVNDTCLGHVIDVPSPFSEPVTNIHILTIHKKLLVKAA